MDWLDSALKIAALWQTKASLAVGGLAIVVVAVRQVRKWLRKLHCQTLILLRGVGIHMIQNRPSTDNQQRLQQNLDWWEQEVVKVLPKAGAKPGEVAQFGALGNVYHQTLIGEKLARLSAIIDRIEGRN